MNFFTQTRGEARALVCAILVGAGLGGGVGGAYLAGVLEPLAQQRAQVERLAPAAARGFSEQALQSEAASMSPGVLAEARRHDPFTLAGGAELDRRAALLAARGDAHLIKTADVRGPAADPFQVAGAMEASRDLDCLTAAVYYESRGDSLAGQAAVAQVVLNRVRHPAFPKTICGVIFQGANSHACQFSFACNGVMRRPKEPIEWAQARSIAARALGGYVMPDVGQAVAFHAARLGSLWGGNLSRIAQVGSHVFYRFGPRYGGAALRGGAYAADTHGVDAVETVNRPVYAAGPQPGPTADGEAAVRLAQASATPIPAEAAGKDAAAKATAPPVAKPAEAPAPTTAAASS